MKSGFMSRGLCYNTMFTDLSSKAEFNLIHGIREVK